MIESSHFEQTIAAPIEFSGIGLHSGAPVFMRLLPAPGGCGILFRRTDLDNFEIPATGRNVAKAATPPALCARVCLSPPPSIYSRRSSAPASTTSSWSSTTSNFRILDGSALPYVEAFRDIGLKTQRRRREYLRIRKTVEVHEGDKFIGVYPGEGYSVSYKIDFPSPIGRQGFVVDLATRDYGAQIAPARTFGFKEDEEKLRNMGLIRGVSESNAIILNGKGVINGPLRFNDEFVRHKVLDLIGDLALAGHRILGHVVAERSAGHAMHTALVASLLKDRSAWELVTLGQQKQKLKSRISARTPALVTA